MTVFIQTSLNIKKISDFKKHFAARITIKNKNSESFWSKKINNWSINRLN